MSLIKYFTFIIITVFMVSCADSAKPNKPKQAALITANTLPYFNVSDLTPTWDKGKHKIPDFSFLNQNGDTITNIDLKGKIYVANFFFTICPGICPQLTTSMSRLQKEYLNDNQIQLLSHTVMPWHDSVTVLKEYATKNNVIDTKWNLLTGDKEALYNIARNGYFADEDFLKTTNQDEFIHTENFILVDKKGHIRGLYNGTVAFDIKRLMRHIELLKKEG